MLIDVEALLPTEAPGLRPHEVYKKLGYGSLISVRHAIRELVIQGRATFEGVDGYRRYWRPS